MAESPEIVRRIEAIVRSPEADRFRDEACRHAVDQPYADNRYVRLLDDLRALLSSTNPPPPVPTDAGGRDD